MPESYTVEEMQSAFSFAYNTMGFDVFVEIVLKESPNSNYTWQIEKWELFQLLTQAMTQIPSGYLERILKYGS